MDTQRLLDTAKGWINPPHPGRGKNAVIGFLLGFFLGFFGVAIYLRSLTEGALCLVLAVVMLPIADSMGELLIPVVCGLWAVGRILWDNKAGPSADAIAAAPATRIYPDSPLQPAV